METISPAGLVDQVFLRCVEDCFEPIMLTDRSGKLTYVNPAWILTYGYQKDEALGKTPRLLRSAHQDDTFYRSMWQTILDPKIGFWRGEVVNQAKDGHLVPVLLTITPHRSASGSINGYMGIAVDLSDQKRMEEQILRQDRLASIGLLAGGLAHEIGNPLGTIRGRAELVLNQIRGQSIAEKNLEIIISQIDRISGLIQSLLRVSRVPNFLQLREVELQSLMLEVSNLMAESCRTSQIELRQKNLKQFVYAEPDRMQQLFLNLIINSTHAIQEQQLKFPAQLGHFIEVRAEKTASGCLISIEDSGCGIKHENLKKLFQPFYTTKAAGKGTGLGLAIVAKLVEEMQGKISVESPGPGQGTTFKLEFKTPSLP
jgi:PAS domain S-box-containing protein